MNIAPRLLLLVLFCFGFLPGERTVAEEPTGEAAEVAKRLLSALEGYNKECQNNTDDKDDLYKFFTSRKLVTRSLAAALKRRCDLDSDPFLNAQDCVGGFLLKGVEMGEGVARVTIRHKPSKWDQSDEEGWDVVMLKEDDLWKIDDIDWGETTLKSACR